MSLFHYQQFPMIAIQLILSRIPCAAWYQPSSGTGPPLPPVLVPLQPSGGADIDQSPSVVHQLFLYLSTRPQVLSVLTGPPYPYSSSLFPRTSSRPHLSSGGAGGDQSQLSVLLDQPVGGVHRQTNA